MIGFNRAIFTPTNSRVARWPLFLALAALLALLSVAPARQAVAQSVSDGTRTLTVSQATGLNPAGQVVTVSGSGYDEEKGIYVAFCVVPPAGEAPSPCGGGIDLSGTGGASQWISSDPPSYGEGLAIPYGPRGTFTVQLAVSPMVSDSIDCRVVQCAIVTRNDHIRASDRSQDVFVPVTFAAPAAEQPTETPAAPSQPSPTAAAGVAAPTASATPTTPSSPTPTATPTPLPAPSAQLSADGRTATAAALTLTVSQAKDLDPGNAQVEVKGSGYDTARGIYIALCAIPEANAVPKPCAAGSPAVSAWVSSDPPDYGKGLAKPYGADGSFALTLTLSTVIDSKTDCRTTACAIVTRNDDTAPSDRSQDLFIPVTFASQSAPASSTATAATSVSTSTVVSGDSGSAVATATSEGSSSSGGLWIALGIIAAVVVIAAGVFVFLRRRGQRPPPGSVAGGLALLAIVALASVSSACSTSAQSSSPQGAATGVPIVVGNTSASAQHLPVTVQSSDGREVTVTDTSRIVSLWGNVTEVIFGLGLGHDVVGRDVTATFPEAAAIPVVTKGHDVSAEAVLSLHPTLVLTSPDTGPSTAIDQIRNVGVPVISFDDPTSIDDIVPRIRSIAAAVGMNEAGEALVAKTQADLTKAEADIPEGVPQPRVAFLYMRGQAGVYLLGGPRSGADSMIAAAGGIDAGTAMGLTRPFTPITSEALAQAAPDVILMTTTGLESVGGIDGLVKIPGIAQTPAGQDRRVITMEDSLLYSFGARAPEALEQLIGLLYGKTANE